MRLFEVILVTAAFQLSRCCAPPTLFFVPHAAHVARGYTISMSSQSYSTLSD